MWSTPGGIQRPWDYRHKGKGIGSNLSAVSALSTGKYRCNDINSWNKAQVLLKQGHSYLDRDGDGDGGSCSESTAQGATACPSGGGNAELRSKESQLLLGFVPSATTVSKAGHFCLDRLQASN